MILAYWHWWLLGFAMVLAELSLPGAFFLWIGITAFISGGLAFIFPLLPLSFQLAAFGIIAPVITIFGRKIFRNRFNLTPPSLLNRRGQQLIGEIIVLDVPIVHGHAHVTVGDSKWRIQGPDLPAGAEAKVVAIEGNMLVVEPYSVK